MLNPLKRDALPYTSAGFRAAGVDPPPSPATRARWRLRGLSGERMPTHLRGGRRYFYPADLAAFFAAVTQARDGARGSVSASQIDTGESAAAERELDEAGI